MVSFLKPGKSPFHVKSLRVWRLIFFHKYISREKDKLYEQGTFIMNGYIMLRIARLYSYKNYITENIFCRIKVSI